MAEITIKILRAESHIVFTVFAHTLALQINWNCDKIYFLIINYVVFTLFSCIVVTIFDELYF
jgi:chromate transport protein ChrA